MNDAVLALGSAGAAAAGLSAAVALHAMGLRRTYVRDLVHVGTGVWVLSWPAWSAPALPIAIPAAACTLTLFAPRRLREAMSDKDERWSGVVLYTVAYAVLTATGFLDRLFPAGAALLALSLGDGLGGAVGRRFGAHSFQVPFAKKKSVEGSATVAVMTAVAVVIAATCFDAHPGALLVLAAALVGAGVEAFAPRGTDNVLLPAAVWAFLRLLA